MILLQRPVKVCAEILAQLSFPQLLYAKDWRRVYYPFLYLCGIIRPAMLVGNYENMVGEDEAT